MPNLIDRIRVALSAEVLSTQQLSESLGESLDAVNEAMLALRKEHRIFNVGMGDSPRWTWRIGTEPVNVEAPPIENEELNASVEALENQDTLTPGQRTARIVATRELREMILRLISERAMTARELTNATGVTMSRVAGVLVDLAREKDLRDVSDNGKPMRYLCVSKPEKPKKS